MKKLSFYLLCSFLSISFFALGQEKKKLPKDDYVITIKTEFGEMTALLYNATPKHKENFIHNEEGGNNQMQGFILPYFKHSFQS